MPILLVRVEGIFRTNFNSSSVNSIQARGFVIYFSLEYLRPDKIANTDLGRMISPVSVQCVPGPSDE